jgi:hypothetical protein
LISVQISTGSSDAKFETLSGVTSSALTRLTNIETKSASVDISISNINSITASNIARLSNLETKSSSVDISLSSINSKTGSYATTGSNQFYGTQVFSGSVYIANDLIVQGSSSIQYISASSVSIGTNIVQLNTANPSVRFAGLTIIDSGSVGGSGSFLYDSVHDEFVFVHRGNGTNITSSHFVLGPETYDNLGNELYLTCNILSKGTGKEHLVDSCIFDNGTTTCIKNNLVGTGTACFAGGLTIGNGDTKLYSVGTSLWWGANGGTDYGQLNWNTGEAIIAATTGNQLTFRTNGVSSATNRMIITCGGNVGIGCNSPTYHLEVRCAASVSSCYLVAMFARSTGANDGIGDIIAFGANGVSSIAGMYRSGGGSWGLELQTANQNTRMRIDNSGISCFACQVCAPTFIVGGGGTAQALFIPRTSNSCYGLSIGEQSLYGDHTNIIRTAGGSSEHLFISAGTNASSVSGYIRLGADRDNCVGINMAPTYTLDVTGIIRASGTCGNNIIGTRIFANGKGLCSGLTFPNILMYQGTDDSFNITNPSSYPNSSFTINNSGTVTFACSVNFNGNGSVTSKVGGVYNGTTTVTIGPSSWNGVMQIMVGVFGNGSGNSGRAMWIGGGYVGSGMPFTEVTRYCAGAVTIGALNANAGCYTFTVGYSFPNSADISVTVIGTNANTSPATISFG